MNELLYRIRSCCGEDAAVMWDLVSERIAYTSDCYDNSPGGRDWDGNGNVTLEPVSFYPRGRETDDCVHFGYVVITNDWRYVAVWLPNLGRWITRVGLTVDVHGPFEADGDEWVHRALSTDYKTDYQTGLDKSVTPSQHYTSHPENNDAP